MPDREARRHWDRIVFEIVEEQPTLHPADLEGDIRKRHDAAVEARDLAIRGMVEAGYPPGQIARVAQCDPRVVRSRLRQMGLLAPKGGE